MNLMTAKTLTCLWNLKFPHSACVSCIPPEHMLLMPRDWGTEDQVPSSSQGSCLGRVQ